MVTFGGIIKNDFLKWAHNWTFAYQEVKGVKEVNA